MDLCGVCDGDNTACDLCANDVEGFSYVRDGSASCWMDEADCLHDKVTCHASSASYDCPSAESCWAAASCRACDVDDCEVCGAAGGCDLCTPGFTSDGKGGCAEGGLPLPGCVADLADQDRVVELNLRVHIMRHDEPWVHASGAEMTTDHIGPADVIGALLPEVNRIWKQARIHWVVESVVEEDMVEASTYKEDVAFVVAAGRDSKGRSDPDRLPRLHRMMDPRFKSTDAELKANANLFHVYLFPFVGNTGQGSAMARFDYHVVVGTWSNKNKDASGVPGYCAPQRRSYAEAWDDFEVGSVGQTVAHELGHVLGLAHDDCDNAPGGCLMRSNGYLFNDDQVCESRTRAMARTPLQ